MKSLPRRLFAWSMTIPWCSDRPDICMEEMTGLEVLARLCAISPKTHVIVITGHEDTAARIVAMEIGTVAFLIKPFDDEQFLEVVHRALGHETMISPLDLAAR